MQVGAVKHGSPGSHATGWALKGLYRHKPLVGARTCVPYVHMPYVHMPTCMACTLRSEALQVQECPGAFEPGLCILQSRRMRVCCGSAHHGWHPEQLRPL